MRDCWMFASSGRSTSPYAQEGPFDSLIKVRKRSRICARRYIGHLTASLKSYAHIHRRKPLECHVLILTGSKKPKPWWLGLLPKEKSILNGSLSRHQPDRSWQRVLPNSLPAFSPLPRRLRRPRLRHRLLQILLNWSYP